MPLPPRKHDDDYEQTTVRVYKVTRRLLNQLQMDLEPGLKRKPAIQELVWKAVRLLAQDVAAEKKEGDKK